MPYTSFALLNNHTTRCCCGGSLLDWPLQQVVNGVRDIMRTTQQEAQSSDLGLDWAKTDQTDGQIYKRSSTITIKQWSSEKSGPVGVPSSLGGGKEGREGGSATHMVRSFRLSHS